MQMGMGKTLTSLENAVRNRENGPTLIVVPKTLMGEWKSQIEKFYNNVKVLYLHKDYHKGKDTLYDNITFDQLTEYHLVVTTYDVCTSLYKKHDIQRFVIVKDDRGCIVDCNHRSPPSISRAQKTIGVELIVRYSWNRVVYDESQKVCNPSTVAFRSIMGIYAVNKWCLTGTPIRNSGLDIWSQLRVCGYDGVSKNHWTIDIYHEERLNRLIFEGTYEKFAIQMPELHVHKHYVEFEGRQETLYQDILTNAQTTFTESLLKSTSYCQVLANLTYLRQICIAPFVLEGNDNKNVESSKNAIRDWITDREGPAGIDSPKIREIVKIVENIPMGEKVLIFSMFTSCIDIVSSAIEIDCPDLNKVVLDGRSSTKKREKMLEQFRMDPDTRVMLINYKVGSEGLNLTCANHIICIEPWWTFATHDQAISRSWRLGQTKPVNVHWVIMKESVETGILNLCEQKREIAESYSETPTSDQTRTSTSGLNMAEMRKLLYETRSNNNFGFEHVTDYTGDCSICFDTPDIALKTPCSHVFCKDCIGKWLVDRRTCPTCRTGI